MWWTWWPGHLACVNLPTIQKSTFTHMTANWRHDDSYCCCLVVCGRKAFSCCCLSLQQCQFICRVWVYKATGCAVASSVVLTSVSSDLGVILYMCFLGFPPKFQMKWLMAVKVPSTGPGLVSQPTSLWVWLICLRRQRTGMGVGEWRDMEFG